MKRFYNNNINTLAPRLNTANCLRLFRYGKSHWENKRVFSEWEKAPCVYSKDITVDNILNDSRGFEIITKYLVFDCDYVLVLSHEDETLKVSEFNSKEFDENFFESEIIEFVYASALSDEKKKSKFVTPTPLRTRLFIFSKPHYRVDPCSALVWLLTG